MKKDDIKALIDAELTQFDPEIKKEEKDDQFIPRFDIPAEKIEQEERVVDELIAGIPRGQGYYIKLYKETRPNEFELKLRIDTFENWSDLEWEVSNIVQQYTKKSPTKWGSGHYRLIFWCDRGIRGTKKPPIDLFIDAGEFEQSSSGTQFVNVPSTPSPVEQLSQVSEMLKVMREVNPTIPPSEVAKLNAEAYNKGLEANASKAASESTTLATLMSAMQAQQQSTMQGFIALITAMMASNNNKPVPEIPEHLKKSPTDILNENLTMLNNMGLLKKDEPKPKSLAEQIQELQVLGLWDKGEKKDENVFDKLTELKSLLGMVTDFSGIAKGEVGPTSTLDKIIDIIGPRVPDMLGNLTGTINNVIEYGKMKMGARPNPAEGFITPQSTEQVTDHMLAESNRVIDEAKPVIIADSEYAEGHPAGPIEQQVEPTHTNNENGDSMLFYGKLFDELYNIINANDYTKFPYIADQMGKLFGQGIFQKMATGEVNSAYICKMIQQFGGKKFSEKTFALRMYNFVDQFVGWIIYSIKEQQKKAAEAQNKPATTATPVNKPAEVTIAPATNPGVEMAGEPTGYFVAECPLCHAEYDYPSREAFEASNKICGDETSSGACQGVLVPVELESNTSAEPAAV